MHIPPHYVVERIKRLLKASRSEDLEIEEPVCCGQSPAFHFHAALTGMLGPPLIGYQVVQVCEPREKRLVTPVWLLEPFHREQFPLDGVMGLIQQGARHWHLRVFEHRLPARFLLLHPVPHACAIGHPSRGGNMVGKAAQPLTQCKHTRAFALSRPAKQGMEPGT